MMDEILKAALSYAERGWQVFPCYTIGADGTCTCKKDCGKDVGKHPMTEHGFKDASSDPAQIQKWFGSEAKPCNLAIATGADSGVTVIDIDTGEGKVGAQTWAELIAEKAEPVTLVARTGSGGMHFFFQYRESLKDGRNRLGMNVDVKNDGGYVIAAPSRHKSGGVYAWLNWGTALAVLPEHLRVPKETPRPDDPTRRPYSLAEVQEMLAVIPAENRDLWRAVGIILGREFKCSDEAWTVYEEWAAKWDGEKDRGHDKIMHECFHKLSQQQVDKKLTLGTIIHEALKHGWVPKGGNTPLDQFLFDANNTNYIYRPTGNAWAASTVNISCALVNEGGKLIKPAVWLQLHAKITSTVCDPDIEGDVQWGLSCRKDSAELVPDPYGAVYNTYRASELKLGDATKAGPYLDHCARVFNQPGDAGQFLNYMAHRVQRPGEKPRFALLLAGEQGTGKDTAIEMCCPAIGWDNVRNIEPSDLDSAFDTYYTATLIRISETANQKHISKWAFNQRVKVLIAGKPDYKGINPKYGKQYFVRLHNGTIITTNDLAEGLYIPDDDRRYDVIACATKAEMGLADDAKKMEYFDDLWGWFNAEGKHHVAAFLHARDLRGFNPDHGQRKTTAHRAAIQAGMSGDEWCADALAQCDNPNMVSGSHLCKLAVSAGEKPNDVRIRLGHAMQRQGYIVYANPGSKDGRWKIAGIGKDVHDKPHTYKSKYHKIFLIPSHKVEGGWEATLDGYPFGDIWES